MITYTGNVNFKDKVSNLIDELDIDNEFNYTIQINEKRLNEKIKELEIKIVDIENTMPNF